MHQVTINLLLEVRLNFTTAECLVILPLNINKQIILFNHKLVDNNSTHNCVRSAVVYLAA